ncbi:hypothetical protein L2E82_20291 [Cichorium intybus]|uniref:Uncharacterized protein n=1 Tax=Cichorium intybus TaxID=13427 RepID=A0ACB9DT98_CICIN|nr:hypothetical protein L2E82_20291 [Cichorium intybus]
MAAARPNQATPHKAFTVANIKAHVPILLDLERHNYDIWREFFTTHCEAYDTLDHIDASHDDPHPASHRSRVEEGGCCDSRIMQLDSEIQSMTMGTSPSTRTAPRSKTLRIFSKTWMPTPKFRTNTSSFTLLMASLLGLTTLLPSSDTGIRFPPSRRPTPFLHLKNPGLITRDQLLLRWNQAVND